MLAYTFIIDFVYFYINFIAFKTSANLLFEYVWMIFLIFFFFFNFFIKFVASCRLFLLANCDTHIVGTITSFFFLKFRFIEWTFWIYCRLKAIEIKKSDLDQMKNHFQWNWLVLLVYFKIFLFLSRNIRKKTLFAIVSMRNKSFTFEEFISINIKINLFWLFMVKLEPFCQIL